jgi:hypothetical protein
MEALPRANGYFLLAAGAGSLALWWKRKIFSWIADGGQFTATDYHSLTRIADAPLPAPAGPATVFQPRPQFLREEPSIPARSFASVPSSSS